LRASAISVDTNCLRHFGHVPKCRGDRARENRVYLKLARGLALGALGQSRGLSAGKRWRQGLFDLVCTLPRKSISQKAELMDCPTRRTRTLSGLRPRYVLFAYRSKQAELCDAAENMGSDVGTTGIVAEVFRKFFFAAVWSSEARLNDDPWHSESPFRGGMHYFLDKEKSYASNLWATRTIALRSLSNDFSN